MISFFHLSSKHSTVAVALLLAILFGACRSSKQALKPNEGFFEPLKSVQRTAPPVPSKQAAATGMDHVADSLIRQQSQQEQRLGALAGQLQLLESSRKGEPKDSTAKGSRVEKINVQQPVRGDLTLEYCEGQYGMKQFRSAANGILQLLKSGVTKELQDRCYYTLGMSYVGLHQYDSASVMLKAVLQQRGSTLRGAAYFGLGQIYRNLGAGKQARAMYEAVLRESPNPDLRKSTEDELKNLTPKK